MCTFETVNHLLSLIFAGLHGQISNAAGRFVVFTVCRGVLCILHEHVMVAMPRFLHVTVVAYHTRWHIYIERSLHPYHPDRINGRGVASILYSSSYHTCYSGNL